MISEKMNSRPDTGYPLENLLDAPAGERMTLVELARAEKKSPPTTWRWAIRGVSGLKLPTVKVGHTRMTTWHAYRWWLEQLTARANGEPVRARTNRQREADIDRAEKELAALGV